MADIGSIPSKWLTEFGWSAEFNLSLMSRVTAAGIDPNDMEKVRRLALHLKKETERRAFDRIYDRMKRPE